MSTNPTNETENHNLLLINSAGLQVKPIKLEEKPKPNKFKSSLSDNNIKSKGIKQKLVNKVKSWNSRDKCYSNHTNIENETADSTKKHTSPDEICNNSNLLRARDSLENLVKTEEAIPKEETTLTLSDRSTSSERNSPVSPKSAPVLTNTSKAGTSGTKSFSWDPFDKQNRKNRKERKKTNKKNEQKLRDAKLSNMPVMEGKHHENEVKLLKDVTHEEESRNVEEDEYIYQYKYFPKNSKSVVFTNEVMVVYFNGDDVVAESSEPLKKEIEQQQRNKEMRRGHLINNNLCLF